MVWQKYILFILVLIFTARTLRAQTVDSCGFSLTADVSNETCLNQHDGSIHLSIWNGMPPFEILWNTGDTTQDLENLAAGVYSVTVTDASGCSQSHFHPFELNSELDSIPIPDGTGTPVLIPFSIDSFPANAVVSDSMPFEQFCVNMEHSWMRDLQITLTCPNGQSVILHNFGGQMGGEVFLGEPYEADEGLPEPIPGVGYTYCWEDNAPNGTWLEYANANNPGTLPSGVYAPYESFTNFYGCPFDGVWTLAVEDLWGIDNGFLFAQGFLVPGDSIFQEIEVELDFPFSCEDDCSTPLPPENILCSAWVDSLITFYNQELDCDQEPFYLIQYSWGNQTFYGFWHYGIDTGGEDFFDCIGTYIGSCFNTIAGIVCDPFLDSLQATDTLWQCGEPLPYTDVSLEADIDFCGSNMHEVWAIVSGPGSNELSFLWNTGAMENHIPVTIDSSYSLTVTNAFGCQTSDTITIEADVPPPLEGSIITTPAADSSSFCTVEISISGGTPPYTYTWDSGSGGQITPGIFSVTITDALGCTLELSDTCSVITGLSQAILPPLKFNLYPNPAKAEINVELEFAEAREGSLLLLDPLGRTLWQKTFHAQNISTRLSLEHLPEGLYEIVWRDAHGKMLSETFVKL